MEQETARSRIVKLMQKSRQAVRLYAGLGHRNTVDPKSEYNERQSKEWERLNKELLNHLKAALDESSQAALTARMYSARDFFYVEWRGSESHLHVKQSELVTAATNSDFIKAALLSNELVLTKARVQAAQAVYHEVSNLIKQSKLISSGAIELSHDNILDSVDHTEAESLAFEGKSNVIPLRARSFR